MSDLADSAGHIEAVREASGTEAAITESPREGYAWGVVVLLTAAFMLSILDRTVLVLFVEPIKRELLISDTQFSLLFGVAFSLLYAVAGLPLGWLADHTQRKYVAFGSVASWSLSTLACGLSGGFGQLFGARIGVGMGEAGLAPTAISMIGDHFPQLRVGRPTAVFVRGGIIGGGVAMIFGGITAAVVQRHGPFHLPLIGEVKGWRAALIFLGVFGAAFSLLFLFLKEPLRRNRASKMKPPSFAEIGALLVSRRWFFLPYFGAIGFSTMVAVGFNTWIPSLFIRGFHWSPFQTGMFYGASMLVGGFVGIMLGGAWIDRAYSRGLSNAYLWAALVASTAALAPAVAAPLVAAPLAAAVLTAVALIFIPVTASVMATGVQIFCRSEMRGRFTALYVITQSVGGWLLGPLIVATFTDRLFHNSALVGRSLALLAAIGEPLTILMIVLALRNPPPIEEERPGGLGLPSQPTGA